tara:strand:+ start:231 stop:467 length:237 start_codon:yes stop_codon:yes gene_type:complete
MDVEKLDLNNVIEVERIKKKLEPDKKLLEFFLLLIDVANKNLNNEDTLIGDIPIEDYVELELSDHESDDELPNPEDDY